MLSLQMLLPRAEPSGHLQQEPFGGAARGPGKCSQVLMKTVLGHLEGQGVVPARAGA